LRHRRECILTGNRGRTYLNNAARNVLKIVGFELEADFSARLLNGVYQARSVKY
jgi:hypothetical protein